MENLMVIIRIMVPCQTKPIITCRPMGRARVIHCYVVRTLDATTTTAPVIRTDIVSTEDISLNLNVVAAATTAEVNKDYRFWEDRKDYSAPILNVESEFIFTHDYGDNGATVLTDTVYESVNQYQYQRFNTLICEVNEKYLFWRLHQDPVDSIQASTKEEHHKDSIGVLDDT